ncbi:MULTISPECIES: TnsA-like heteromeric transposase endonuclease subunit [Streptomyces]|uniref:TnsA-like heteromeric transposase endonuclease subunit n=1 Tax=Streptomyces TaxID=1883 RepID=UPI0025B0CD67|nr:TnsA-like heteromeric transposase endonuclease subunit [Streptomyces sp. S.PNR 29]MDN0195947.1 TnsA-like heteromeric transposase endonuclease subunit [Streptomyces sp. S.PNR 29]
MLEIPFADLRLAHFTESKPWRTVRSVHGMTHHSGSYASATMGRHVVYESRLELARLLLADFDPSVQRIHAQPCRMTARIDGRVRHHVPDFLLVMRSGVAVVVNVKPEDLLADPKIKEALAWPGDLIERHGWAYEVWSGADPVVLENIRFLAAYRRPGVVPAAEIERAWESVQDGDQLAAVERRLAEGRDRHEVRPPLMALLWAGRLTTDLTQPLSGDWVLRRSE